jgi:hypothetical protein
MALRPEIHRYFVDRASDEVVRLLSELRAEEAQPKSVTDTLRRVKTLRARLNEIDPYYEYGLSVGTNVAPGDAPGAVLTALFEGARVDVFPRYEGATRDRPITVKVELQFGPDDKGLEDAWIRSIDYGSPVSLPGHVNTLIDLDAPLGLSYKGAGAEIALRGSPVAPNMPIGVVADIRNGGVVLASLPLSLTVASGGVSGFICKGRDASGWLELEITVDVKQKRLTCTFGLEQIDAMPAAALPLVRWLVQFRSPHRLEIRSQLWKRHSLTDLPPAPLAEPSFLRVVEALDEIQGASGTVFSVPTRLSATEQREILDTRRLLLGDKIQATWSGGLKVGIRLADGIDASLQGLLKPEGVAMLIEADQMLELREHRIPIGRVRTNWNSVRLRNRSALTTALSSGSRDILLDLVPGKDALMTRQRVGPTLGAKRRSAATKAPVRKRASR